MSLYRASFLYLIGKVFAWQNLKFTYRKLFSIMKKNFPRVTYSVQHMAEFHLSRRKLLALVTEKDTDQETLNLPESVVRSPYHTSQAVV